MQKYDVSVNACKNVLEKMEEIQNFYISTLKKMQKSFCKVSM